MSLVKTTLLKLPAVKTAVAAIAPLAREYGQFLDGNYGWLHPDQAIRALKAEIPAAATPADAQKLMDAIERLSNPGAGDMKRRVSLEASAKWRKLQTAIDGALEVVTTEVEAGRDGAIEAESVFFQRHGVPVERTGVSRQWDQLLAEVNTVRASIQGPSQFPSLKSVGALAFLEIEA